MIRGVRRAARVFAERAARFWNQRQRLAVVPSSIFHGAIAYQEDGLVSSQVPTYLDDPKFLRALRLSESAGKMTGTWRIYICCWFAEMVQSLEGDFVECGVNTGGYSRAVIDYIGFQKLGKTFYLFDTFAGLVKSQITQAELDNGIGAYFQNYPEVFEIAKKNFEGLNAKLIKGEVPATLSQCPATKVAYLSIDMNCVAPEVAALEFFWPKIVPGGVVLLDDYGFSRHAEQRKAHDAFASRVGARILVLPTGQGVVIKSHQH